MRKLARSIIIFLAVVLCSASVAYGQTTKTPPIDPRAEQMLRQMSDYLASLQSFSVHVDAVIEGITSSGERLDAARSTDILLQRPNKLRINVVSAHHNARIYYDGTTFGIFSPRTNFYSTWSAPGTIDQMVVIARKKYGLILPGADLLTSDPYSRMIAHVTAATYVGDVPIQGVMTHQLAFRQPDVDWQIWTEADATPLPRRIIITDKRVSGSPQYTALFSDWNTAPAIGPDTFVFTPPAGAQKIPMRMLPSLRQQAAPVQPQKKGVYK